LITPFYLNAGSKAQTRIEIMCEWISTIAEELWRKFCICRLLKSLPSCCTVLETINYWHPNLPRCHC